MGKPFQEYRLSLSQLTLNHSSLPSSARKQSNLERNRFCLAIAGGTIHHGASYAGGQFAGHRLRRDRAGADRKAQQQDGAEDERTVLHGHVLIIGGTAAEPISRPTSSQKSLVMESSKTKRSRRDSQNPRFRSK